MSSGFLYVCLAYIFIRNVFFYYYAFIDQDYILYIYFLIYFLKFLTYNHEKLTYHFISSVITQSAALLVLVIRTAPSKCNMFLQLCSAVDKTERCCPKKNNNKKKPHIMTQMLKCSVDLGRTAESGKVRTRYFDPPSCAFYIKILVIAALTI